MMATMMSAEHLTPERLALMREISDTLMRDPAFLKTVEAALETHAADVKEHAASEEELRSFGWSTAGVQPDIVPAAAAAALAPGAAALAAPPVAN